LRRAARIVEAAWRTTPHPELAAVYLNLRPGDAAKDRLRRAETLAKLSMWAPEARLALARAALEAREFGRARVVLQPLLAERPTMRACLLMADLEQAEHGTTGRVREWLARAAHAARDAAWIADGLVSDRWAPVSPITGKLDAFQWQVPPEVLSDPAPSLLDDVVADLDDKADEPAWQLAPPRAAEPPPPAEPEPAVVVSAPEETPTPAVTAESPEPESKESEPAPVLEPARPAEAAPASESSKPNGSGAPHVEPAPVVFPVPHAPDDPGADDAENKRSRFRLLG
jgi:HemY protein